MLLVTASCPSVIHSPTPFLSRRAFAGAATAGAFPAAAVDEGKLISGFSPADGIGACVASHSTSDFGRWYREVWARRDAPAAPWADCFRCLVCRGVEDEDAVVVSFFSAAALPGVRAFYDESSNPLWREGREAGWLSGEVQRDFFEPALYRGAVAGPPPQRHP